MTKLFDQLAALLAIPEPPKYLYINIERIHNLGLVLEVSSRGQTLH